MMDSWLVQIALGMAGIFLLYYGAEYLIKGGVSIANRLRIPPLVIGLTLVAFGTSAPELVVSISASLRGSGNISIGNVVGSNICNIALILGCAALIVPVKVAPKLLRMDMPMMVGSSALLTIFCWVSHGINRIQAGIFLLMIAGYTGWRLFCDRSDNANGEDDAELKTVLPMWKSLPMVVGGLAGLVFGARFFVNAAIFVAEKCQVSDAVIGLTVVAVGTSLPELATSVVAAFKGESDIAIGNVVGSNIFNVLMILGCSPMIRPIAAPGINGTDLMVMMGLTLLLWAIMQFRRQVSRLAGGVLLAGYCAYVAWLFILLR